MDDIVRTRGDHGEELENGVEVESCADRHDGAECKNVAEWNRRHPIGVHPRRPASMDEVLDPIAERIAEVGEAVGLEIECAYDAEEAEVLMTVLGRERLLRIVNQATTPEGNPSAWIETAHSYKLADGRRVTRYRVPVSEFAELRDYMVLAAQKIATTPSAGDLRQRNFLYGIALAACLTTVVLGFMDKPAWVLGGLLAIAFLAATRGEGIDTRLAWHNRVARKMGALQ